jgi:beta-lactam-binding protein with PASTA domain
MPTGDDRLVRVPSLCGVDIVVAHRLALAAGVGLRGPRSDSPLPLSGVVRAQDPPVGSVLGAGDDVTLWIDPYPVPNPEPEQ